METLRNWGIEFVLSTLKELQLASLNVLPFVYTLQCMCQCISDCVEWQSMWENWKMGDLSDFERGQIVGARLAAASVIKIATWLSVTRATVSKTMSASTNHGKTKSAKRNSGRKSTLTERDRHTLRRSVSRNHRTTTAQVTGQQNWIFILKTLF
jgi:hypothetical protein